MNGVTDGSEAAAGEKGEYRTASNTTGTALTTLVGANVCTLALPAGDWHVWGSVAFVEAANTIPTVMAAGTSLSSATLPTVAQAMGGVGSLTQICATMTKGVTQIMQTGFDRVNIAAAQNVYLVAQATFSGGLLSAQGFLCARRIR